MQKSYLYTMHINCCCFLHPHILSAPPSIWHLLWKLRDYLFCILMPWLLHALRCHMSIVAKWECSGMELHEWIVWIVILNSVTSMAANIVLVICRELCMSLILVPHFRLQIKWLILLLMHYKFEIQIIATAYEILPLFKELTFNDRH